MRISDSLMVVLIINEHGIFPLEGEGETPIAADRHRPMVLQFPVKGVQLPAWGVHVFRRSRVIQREELLPQSLGMARLDFGSRSRPEKQFHAFVTEAFYHPYSV